MNASPLASEVLFHIGPAPISRPVATTWALMALLTAVSWFGMRKRADRPGPLQALLEIVVETQRKQLSEIVQRDPTGYLPLLGTLFIFIVAANLVAVVPDMTPPTGHIETPAALAVIVFFSAHAFGVRAQGLGAYLRRYARPSPLLIPLNVLSEITRTFSLMVRLFGNMMSHEMIIAIVVFLAGLLVPVPFMILGVLIGIIQAYIFTVLASVYVGAAVGDGEAG